MKHLFLMLFLFSFTSLAKEGCALIDKYFFAYTLDRQEYVEVCVHKNTLRYTSKHAGQPEKVIIQELSNVQINKVLNGYELIVKQNNTLYAIMDNDQRPSLLTVNDKRGIVFFTDLDHNDQFVSRLYALNIIITQLREEEEVDMDV